MQIILIKPHKIYRYPFPTENVSNYWINDLDDRDNERKLISINREGDSWFLKSSDKAQICENKVDVDTSALLLNKFYTLKVDNKLKEYYLYVTNNNDTTFKLYEVTADKEYTIGKSSSCDIVLDSPIIADKHAVLKFNQKVFSVESTDPKYGVYLNDLRVANAYIHNGDSMFIMGYRFIFLNNTILINNFLNTTTVKSRAFLEKQPVSGGESIPPTEDDDNVVLYDEKDYFHRSPRFVTSIVPEEVVIDSPPNKEQQGDMPFLLRVGPMLTMGITSLVSGVIAFSRLASGTATVISVLPTLVISGSMLLSTILWPTLSRKYSKKQRAKKERYRQERYKMYLAERRKKIDTIRINQHQILLSNFIDPKDCQIIIVNKKRTLWERKSDNEDFMTVRVGIGTVPLKIDIKFSEEHFSLDEDNMLVELRKVTDDTRDIKNAPVTINLVERNKLVVVGETQYKDTMLKSMILQLMTFHSYGDLKFVFMINNDDNGMWEDFKTLPHTWSNSRDIRFFANNYDDMNKLSFYLEQVFTSRAKPEEGKEKKISYREAKPYYLIFTDNIKKTKNIEIINKILKEPENLGFGIVVINDGIANLPNECVDFLMADGEKSAVIKNDLNKDNQQGFIMDNVEGVNIPICCEKLANIPIKFPVELDEAKNSVGFLEMYEVGKVEQLNSPARWKENNPVNSLSVPIGIHPDQELFNLDLHEKFHGPHGLIAGTTGSGKSEFIITYILSMAVNFSPEEVSFVLIDYKGGGLAGAFENKEKGIRLPHLAGSITNLDTVEMNRSLASIQSELKRRQSLFNQAKTKLNESTIDIYKYQKLYRDGMLDIPMSHLFIISDEFAELKKQQPEFMDQLISTARIGRSLGVHLILATQKPSGIVNDQIWSNSKFKVCLKVQEKADSMDVIKCPDAAALKKAGRFYLQVGYNDYFAMGQAAWCGGNYYPTDTVAKKVDRSFSFLNNIGDIVKTVENKPTTVVESQGEELPNILKYVTDIAKSKNLSTPRLWLDRIPNEIIVSDIMKKYNHSESKFVLNPLIGEYDDPNSQSQHLLTLPINEKGNTIIYGSAGSGKEMLLTTLIYSLIINHTSDEVNIYAFDFGSETLRVFKKTPQVGDVILLNESEKLVNLFKVISNTLEERKKEFADYNGDYNTYIKNSGKIVPRIIVIINNFEVFNETYEIYVDQLTVMSRECERYGIYFILTAAGSSAIRYKTSQNFSNILCLQFNDDNDYTAVLGPSRGIRPSACRGRGLVKINGAIYEYQTATPYNWEKISDYLKAICDKLASSEVIKAEEIAILPDQVRYDNVSKFISDYNSVPIGIEKEELKVSTYDFTRSLINVISSSDTSAFDNFIPSLVGNLSVIPNKQTIVIDPLDIVHIGNSNVTRFTDDYTGAFNIIKSKIEEGIATQEIKETITSCICVIVGLDMFRNNLEPLQKDELSQLILSAKKIRNMRFIFVDTIDKIKALEYDEFYKSNSINNQGIWVGSGIADQYTIKLASVSREQRNPIENNFGYNISRGRAVLVKLIDYIEKK